MGYEKNMIYFLTFCINHTPISPATKTIKAHVCSATNPVVLTKTLIATTTLTTIAGNASTTFLASLLSASASLFNHLLKTPSFFDGEPPPSPPPPSPSPKTTETVSTIVEKVIERAVSSEIMVQPWSQNKVRILSVKDVFLTTTLSRVCLILATCVWISFQFSDSISCLACFLVFKSSNLSLYSSLCCSK